MKRIVIISAILAMVMSAGVLAQTPPTHVNLVRIPTIADDVPVPGAEYRPFVAPPVNLTDGAEDVDFVTVGSLMPYRMEAVFTGTEVPTGTNFQIDYFWRFVPQMDPPGPSPLAVLQKATATTPIPTGAATASTIDPVANWYKDENEVTVRMPRQTGNITLSTSARFVFNGDVMCQTGTPPTPVDYRITVVDRPKITPVMVDGVPKHLEVVACVNEDVPFPSGTGATALLNLSGYGPYNVNFSITRTPMTGTDVDPYTYSNLWLVVTGNELVFPDALFDEPGVYEIEILNLTDRISRKSLDQDEVKAVAGADFPASSLKVFIFPDLGQPGVLSPTQHIRNNP